MVHPFPVTDIKNQNSDRTRFLKDTHSQTWLGQEKAGLPGTFIRSSSSKDKSKWKVAHAEKRTLYYSRKPF